MIIATDTIWRSGDVIDLGGLVQIEEGVTLTIESGVTVQNGTLEVFGNLLVRGGGNEKVLFNEVDLRMTSIFPNSGGYIDAEFMEMTGGSLVTSRNVFMISSCRFSDTVVVLNYPPESSAVLGSEFSGGISLGLYGGVEVLVRGNSFANMEPPQSSYIRSAILLFGSDENSVIISENTFSLGDGYMAITIEEGSKNLLVEANDNFFGSSDYAAIYDMILDRSDDLKRNVFVSLDRFLNTPSSDAPVVPLIIRGSSAGDMLIGGAVGDILNGGLGADTMVGGAGDDTYVVDNIADAVTEISGGGEDTIRASVSYTLASEVEALELTGVGAISGTGNDQANFIVGNAGDNVLNGGLGADTLIGAAGGDTYLVDDLGDFVSDGPDGSGVDTVRSSISFVLLSDDLENLELIGTFAINGTGNANRNSITGNSSANIIDGGAGSDTMSGGAGDDVYLVDIVGDRVIEVAEGGLDTVRTSVTYLLGDELENLELMGVSAINATGNALSNRMTGNTAANVLNGGLGADTMMGGAGNDTYVVDNTDDLAIELVSGGIDLVRSSVSFVLGANFETLQLTGSVAAKGFGNDLDNRLVGNAATNTLDGRRGDDTIFGGGGSDAVIGGTGNDSISGDAGSDTLLGQNGIDVMSGGAGADVLGGGAGNDLLNGGNGRDKLSGYTGSDTLIGGGGLDVFVFAGKFGTDVITDFRNGADVIDLSGRGLSFADLKIRMVGDDTVIVLDTGRVILEDFSASTLRSGMFDLL